MELVWLATGGAGLAAAAIMRVRAHRLRAKLDKEGADTELAAIRHLAEGDAVLFGEELARLGEQVPDADLDADAQADYQAALDSYESALRVADRMQSLDDISEVIDALAAGRYAVACVRARLDGVPLPTYRIPCFFDPRHGPAATELLWNAPGQGTRKVPACSQDAARRAEGEDIDVMMVRINGQTVPYWAAGGLHQPYTDGYVPRTVREATLDLRASHSLEANARSVQQGFPP